VYRYVGGVCPTGCARMDFSMGDYRHMDANDDEERVLNNIYWNAYIRDWCSILLSRVVELYVGFYYRLF
jgi:hypothetical protein